MVLSAMFGVDETPRASLNRDDKVVGQWAYLREGNCQYTGRENSTEIEKKGTKQQNHKN